MTPATAEHGDSAQPPATAAPWFCGRCGDRFADLWEAQRHADTCDRPAMRLSTTAQLYAAVKVWGGITGDVWAQCGKCHETYADAETLDALVRWADVHICER